MLEHTKGDDPTMANDFTTTRKLSQADPAYQQLEQTHTEACKAVHDAAAKPRSLTYKLQRLLLARDAVLHYASETECPILPRMIFWNRQLPIMASLGAACSTVQPMTLTR
jgi:hypothetical protein